MTTLSDIRAELQRAQEQLDAAYRAQETARTAILMAMAKLKLMTDSPMLTGDVQEMVTGMIPLKSDGVEILPAAIRPHLPEPMLNVTPKIEVVSTPVVSEPLTITEEWQHTLDTLLNGSEHVFCTGGAGVGKTTMLEQVVTQYPGNLMVVAFTGVAALRAGGSTIHREFRFKTEALARDDVTAITDPRKALMMRKVDALLIDEISMVRADVMDAIDISLQKTRNNKQPFGGVRILAFGDLFQLPPVSTDKKEQTWLKHRYGVQLPYFFHAECWRDQQPKIMELTTVFRQKDADFAGALNAIRNGTMTPEHLSLINSRVNYNFVAPTDELWLELTTTNDAAARANEKMLGSIKSDPRFFEAMVMGDFKDKDMPTDRNLQLKVGAVVMFVKNDAERRWVNGTMGKVTNLDPLYIQTANGAEHQVDPVSWVSVGYEYDEEKKKLTSYERGKFTQIPVKVAAAITVHKSQGSSFDRCIVNMPNTFASGQGYVALSRCRTLPGMVLRHRLKDVDVKVDPEVVKFMRGEPIAKPEVITQGTLL